MGSARSTRILNLTEIDSMGDDDLKKLAVFVADLICQRIGLAVLAGGGDGLPRGGEVVGQRRPRWVKTSKAMEETGMTHSELYKRKEKFPFVHKNEPKKYEYQQRSAALWNVDALQNPELYVEGE